MTSAIRNFFLFGFLLFSAVTLNAQSKDLRIIFFSDNYTSASALQNSFEQRLGQQSGTYNLEKAEKLQAFFSGQSYVFSTEAPINKDVSAAPGEFSYRAAGFKDVITTDSAIMF